MERAASEERELKLERDVLKCVKKGDLEAGEIGRELGISPVKVIEVLNYFEAAGILKAKSFHGREKVKTETT